MEKKKVFKVEKRTALLDFAEGSTWHGVEARVAISVPFKELFWFQKNAQDINPENSTQAVFKFGETFLMAIPTLQRVKESLLLRTMPWLLH